MFRSLLIIKTGLLIIRHPHPTSTVSQRVLQPLHRQSTTNSVYFALFCSLASPSRSSQGKVSSSRTTCFVDADVNTMSGWSGVAVMCSGNLSCLLRSTCSCQSLEVARSPPEEVDLGCTFSPALTKVIEYLFRLFHCLFIILTYFVTVHIHFGCLTFSHFLFHLPLVSSISVASYSSCKFVP